jgi:hypothetical protein
MPSPDGRARSATAAAGSWQSDTPAATHTDRPAPASDLQADLRRHAQEPAPRLDRHEDDHGGLAGRAEAARDSDWPDATHTDPQTVIEPREDEDTDGVDTLPPPELDFPPVPPTTPAADAAPVRAEEPVPPLSFLHRDTPPSVWRRPIVRIALVAALVLLLALLAMQFLVKERDRVAAMQPAVRPLLEALCVAAGCSVAPLRQIESIVIDSSSFSRVRGDDYRLGFALKNTAPIDIAMPAIELSLTDPQDEPVIRRVILPSEFGARSAALASASVWTGSLALTVQPEVATQRITGYRLLAFYP